VKPRDDIAICAYGAAAIQQQVQNLKNEWKGVRSANEDIEYVHRMRVATRRFRSAFDIFASCLPKKKRSTWETAIVHLTQALSNTRDLDVHIAMLTEFSQSLPEPQYHAGISRLILRLRQEREQVQPKIVKDLNRIKKKGVLEELETTLKKLVLRQTEAPSRYSPHLYQVAFKSINRCMNKLLAFDGRIQNPINIKDLHDMRLEAKSLRYTIEIFQDLYTDRLETQLSVVENMQSQLGDIHDDDNWIANLDKFLKSERKRTLAFYGHEGPYNLLIPGINYLRESRQENRNKQYDDFIQKWEGWKTENLWGSLYQVTKLPTVIYQPEADESEEPTGKDGAEIKELVDEQTEEAVTEILETMVGKERRKSYSQDTDPEPDQPAETQVTP
jgi:CHAD domain-containing protein